MRLNHSKYTAAFLLFLTFAGISTNSDAQFLKVSNDGRRLINTDRSNFLWIADTAWELFHRITLTEADYYFKKRKEQQFTVIQAAIVAEDDGLRSPNAYDQIPFLDQNPSTPNEAYFEYVDRIIDKANKMHLVMALLPTWADKLPSDRDGSGPVVFNETNAYTYGFFLGRTYKTKNVIWILGGDRNINTISFPIWSAMADGLKKGSENTHLISYHPAGEQSSSRMLHYEKWLDFNVYQSGQASKFFPVYRFAEKDYRLTPPKPFIDAEPCYEDIPVSFWKYLQFKEKDVVPKNILNSDGTLKDTSYFKSGFFTDYDVRISNYRNLLSGAFGVTYGNNAIWQMFSRNRKFIIPSLYDWKEGLNSAGAKQLKHIIKLFERISFETLRPDETLIINNPIDVRQHIVSASNSKNILAYTPVNCTINLISTEGYQYFYWFNPKRGTFSSKRKILERKKFTTPIDISQQDWILILEK